MEYRVGRWAAGGLLIASLFASTATSAAPADGPMTAAEVNSRIIGHSVALTAGSMTWLFYVGGKYLSDDGKDGSSGTYKVRPDGQLCWTDKGGAAGCFQFVKKGAEFTIRRTDAGNEADVGEAKAGSL